MYAMQKDRMGQLRKEKEIQKFNEKQKTREQMIDK